MATIDDLIASLALGQAQQQLIAEADPYRGGADVANTIGQAVVSAGPQYSTRDKILAGALSGLTSGLFSGFSNDYQARAQDAYTDAVQSFGLGRTPTRPTVLSPQLFSMAQRQGGIFRLQRGLQQEQLDQKLQADRELLGLKAEQDIKTEIAKEVIRNPRRAGQAMSALESLFGRRTAAAPAATPAPVGVDTDESGLGLALGAPVESVAAPTKSQLVEQATTPAAKDPALERVLGILGGNFGQPESIEDKQVRIAQRFQDEGATPGEAWSQAGRQLEADRIALKTSTKKVEDVREAANQALQMADTAQLGIEGAGETGGIFGGVRDLASKAAAVINPEQKQKQASQTLLDSVRPQIVQTMRSPGAISDFESRMLIGAGPSSSNTPEANAQIVSKIRGVAQLNNEYADFLDWYRERMGTITGAEKVWQAYKKDHPLVVTTETGEADFNLNRPSVFDWLNGVDAPSEVKKKVVDIDQEQTAKSPIASPAAANVLRPSWYDSYRFVRNSLAEGAANTAAMLTDYGSPAGAASTLVSQITGQPTAGEKIQQAVKQTVGSPEDTGIVGTVPNIARGALNAVAFPGAPFPNALAGAGSAAAKEAGAGPVGQVVAATVSGSAPAMAKKLSQTLVKSGKAFDRTSIGALAKDFVKSQRDKGIINADDEARTAATRISDAIEEIAETKGLGFWRDPDSLQIRNEKELQRLGSKIGDILIKTDEQGVRPIVDFESPNSAVNQLIGKTQAAKADVKKAFSEFYTRLIDPVDGWDGRTASLNDWKSSIGDFAFSGAADNTLKPQIARKVQRAIYADLDKAISKAVTESKVVKPNEWKPLLREYSNHAEIAPVLNEQVAKAESSNVAKVARGLLRSSGGTLTTPTMIGAAIGGASGGVPGLLVGAGLGALGSPTGQGVAGSVLKGAGRAIAPIGASGSTVIPAVAAGALQSTPQDELGVAMNQARQSVAPIATPTPQSTPQTMETAEMPINPLVRQFEGGQQLKAYPPPARGSGVTVATGIDLGQRSAGELRNLGISDQLLEKVKPYLGKKDDEARRALKKSPLTLTEEEANELDTVISSQISRDISNLYAESTGQDLASLPEEARTVVESLAYNFGPALDKKIPTIWRNITSGNWEKVAELLRTTKWKQPELASRRNQEADLLDTMLG